jgi:hypothetical protein
MWIKNLRLNADFCPGKAGQLELVKAKVDKANKDLKNKHTPPDFKVDTFTHVNRVTILLLL